MEEANGSTPTIVSYDVDGQTLHIDLGEVGLTLEHIVPVFVSEGSEGTRRYIPFSDEEIALLLKTVEYMAPRAKEPANRDFFEAIRARLAEVGG